MSAKEVYRAFASGRATSRDALNVFVLCRTSAVCDISTQ